MDSYFKKIKIEIFYPGFDAGYDKKISSIHYQVTYPDLKGSPTSRVQCMMTGNNSENKTMQLAVWTASSSYSYMGFDFLKTDSDNADLTVSRTIYFKPEMPGKPLTSQIIINTKSEDVNGFKI